MDNSTIWKIIDSHFQDNRQSLVRHHIESYNDFFKNGIHRIFRERNPIRIQTQFDKDINDFRSQCIMYIGGKNGSKVYFGKPVIYDNNDSHYMYPNEARLRNMTYGMTIHYDVDIEFIDILKPGQFPTLVGGNDDSYTNSDSEEEEEEDKHKHNKDPEELKKEVREERITMDKIGGAPVPKKRVIKKKTLAMTPAETAIVREATEQSMISENKQVRSMTLEKVYLGKFPIMVQSEFCILSNLPKETRFSMGECSNDIGGYFIIDGKEKTVIAQEKFADNMLYIKDVNDEKYLYSAEIRSVSENVSKPIRTLSVKIVSPTASYTNKNIVVNIPNLRKPVPLFILFRALGILSDKQIISMCLLDMEKYESMIDLFAPSVHDAGGVMTQRDALQYIAFLTKGKTVYYAMEILSDYFLPHIGEVNFMKKAYYLGYMTFRLLSVYTGLEQPTDRDNFKYKRIELVGSLMSDLFREYYKLQQRQIHLAFDEQVNYNAALYEANLWGLVQEFHKKAFSERLVESGFKKAMKGNWGSQTHTKRIGVVQDLNRLSFNSALSHLRKTNLPLDPSVKLVGPRILHSSQWGYFDPIDTPDGGNIGIHKHLSITTYVTQGYSREPMIIWLREKVDLKMVEDCSPAILSTMTKVILNGLWAGSLTNPFECVEKIKLFRRNALLPIYTSVSFDIKLNTIFIYTDAGRICRPIFYNDTETGKMSFLNGDVLENIESGKFDWTNLITGFNKKNIADFDPNAYKMYTMKDLYNTEGNNPAILKRFLEEKAIIDYIDPSESENALIALNKETIEKNQSLKYTHLEIHESVVMGMLGNMIIFPENNPAVRNSFSCGQSKQAVSVYHTNHRVRMDKTAVVLNSGQTPLVKSRYLEHICNEGNPYGENAIVAIMCYTGYNVEDAILVNEGALKRGLFRTTYYSTYESHEEKSITQDGTIEKRFTNIESENNVLGTKPGYYYDKLDKQGIIKENTLVNEKTVLIGITSTTSNIKDVRIDMSKTPKKGQLGIVDKTFITDSEEGQRIAKVRIREERIPNLGDKMASRAGQKGTIGLVIPEEDMPFTKDGIRPDLIINPHALPTRQTIGQLVECLTGKLCCHYGAFGDCTAFNNKGSKISVYGQLLPNVGFHSSGNEVMYNGMTGEQIEAEIFMGPTYYMRLKHMVKDKINYRARGPMTALTKQPVSGRANDGGLRIGEMERDVLISHGISEFLRESMMERGDKYQIAICNNTGMLAIYNPNKNIFMSPMADGPIRYVGSMDGKEMHIDNITKFGRSFSIVKVPYTLKLLIQELQVMNLQMRLITDDNIQQLENMTYSKNISKLMNKKDATPHDVILYNKHKISTSNQEKNIKIGTPKDEFETSPLYPNTSPAYEPSPTSSLYNKSSPMYNPNTPEYEPTSPDFPPPVKGLYEPTSPDFPPPVKGLYEPTSPDFPPPVKGGSEWMVGGKAHYRGDSIPERIWNVTRLGDRFITIQTDDLHGSEDSIKVVSPHDLYRVGDYSYYNPINNVTQDSQQISMNQMKPLNPMSQMMPSIHIAPVIKVLNGGSDFSSDPVEHSNNKETSPTIVTSDVSRQPDNNLITKVANNDNNNKIDLNNTIPTNGGFTIKKIE